MVLPDGAAKAAVGDVREARSESLWASVRTAESNWWSDVPGRAGGPSTGRSGPVICCSCSDRRPKWAARTRSALPIPEATPAQSQEAHRLNGPLWAGQPFRACSQNSCTCELKETSSTL